MSKTKETYVNAYNEACKNVSSENSNIVVWDDFPNITEEVIVGYYISKYKEQAPFIWLEHARKAEKPTEKDLKVTLLFHELVMAG